MKRKAASGRENKPLSNVSSVSTTLPGGMLFGISSGAKCGDSKLG
jgi:hypothetical protein